MKLNFFNRQKKYEQYVLDGGLEYSSYYKHPMHPYTVALLSAIPVPDRKHKKEKIVLEGDLPSPVNPPSGCVFHTRCPRAQEICKTQVPQQKDYGNGHCCACHFPQE